MSYLLDANVFMSAKNLHYGLDFCPVFLGNGWCIRGTQAQLSSIEVHQEQTSRKAEYLFQWLSCQVFNSKFGEVSALTEEVAVA